ncbi:MAG: helix-turn-helix domain-containing protein [Verrucomicrobia bacterium]|nr:MAG: helix-turn-helix domain-containing protein [Verrucomicrobiota bacterium]
MPTVAEQLRHAREAQKLTLQQVVDVTKVRTDHLIAIEEGRYDVFVAPVYIRGFVRSYAKLLKLDVPQLMAALDEELGRTEKFSEPPPLSNEPRGVVDFLMLQLSRVNWRKSGAVLAVLVIVGLIILIATVWRKNQKANPAAGIPPAVYRPARTNTGGDTLPLPTQPARR